MNRGLSLGSLWLTNANHVKFTEGCVMCMENHFFIEKCLQMSLTWICHYKLESKRQFMRLIRHWLSGKEKVLGTAVSKGWNIIGPITIDFLEKGATVNSAPYSQLLRQYLPNSLNELVYIIITIMSCWEHRIPLFSLVLHPYHPSLFTGSLDCIHCLHKADVCLCWLANTGAYRCRSP